MKRDSDKWQRVGNVRCQSTYTRGYELPCSYPAEWLIFWSHAETGELGKGFACAQHLHKLLIKLVPDAEYSREMFRVLPWAEVLRRQEILEKES